MPDTPTPKRGLLRPPLGTKPWKEAWDYNFLKLDNDVGGIIDGTIAVGNAARFANKLPADFSPEVAGTFTGLTFLDNTIRIVKVDHSVEAIFTVPGTPGVTTVSGVRAVVLADIDALGDYGGGFRVAIENSSGGSVDGATISWKRRGFKV